MRNQYTDKEFTPFAGHGVRCTPRRVLIVDDNDSVRRVFKRVLAYSLPECRTDLAANGSEAVRLFGLNHYALLLMDLCMPVMDGDRAVHEIEEFCEALDWVKPQVVFCTGYIPSDSVIEQIRKHGDSYCLLHKPVDNRTLVASIRSRLAA